MARYANDGMLSVWLAPSVASIAAPTVAEINAGTKVSPFMTKDGIVVPTNQNMVDDGNLEDIFDAQTIGSWGGPLSIKGKRNNASGGTDTLWNLITYGLANFTVVRRGIATATAATIGQAVEVYPTTWHHPVMETPATNEQARFTAMAGVTSTPNIKALIA